MLNERYTQVGNSEKVRVFLSSERGVNLVLDAWGLTSVRVTMAACN